ncbi:MAG: hypothetical protein R2863_11940 [Candidatus Kapaibacterium sp.]|nr:hypothetical protein [Ignavibacteriota bacterium]
MKKVFLLLALALLSISTASALEPIKVAIINTGSAPVSVEIRLNNYTGGTATLLYTQPATNYTPNGSGIIIANISGAGWTAIASSSVTNYHILDVYVDGSLAAQYRLDQQIISQSQSNVLDPDGNLTPLISGTGSVGTDGKRWDELYVTGNTVHIGPNGGEVSNTEMKLSYNTSPNKGRINVDNNDVIEITKNEVKISNTNPSNTNNILEVNSNGTGTGVRVNLNNASNGGRGVDVAHNGVGPGVFSTSAGGNGVWGITSSISAAGVIGDNTFGEAVVGRNRGGNGVGAVVGRNDSTGYGVRGFNTKGGIGVLGQAGISGGTGSAGKFENVNASNFSDALIVTTNSTGNAARFTGNVVVSGNLTVSGNVAKGGGSFMIDHPLDPKNKILYHSFVESPDMKNINDGIVILDNNGEAWVQLPNWFQALNKDFRYQLTPIGAPCSGLYIAQEVKDNRFQIAGGIPNLKVSWMVTGIRHDPYAEKNRIVVEVDKTPEQKGHYLQPDAFGEIKVQSINIDNNFNELPSSTNNVDSNILTPNK